MTHLGDTALQELADSGATHPHLDACQGCRAEVAAYRRLAARLSHLSDPEPPAEFVAGVLRRIDRGEASWWAWALLAAGLCSLYALLAMAPGRPSPLSALHGFVLAARVLRGALLSFSGTPLLATALLVLAAVVSIHQLVKEERT